jgi:threonine dehydrogenase-like Zn-dependent dehydrogenase
VRSAKVQGAWRVIAIDDVPERLQMASHLGAEAPDRHDIVASAPNLRIGDLQRGDNTA